MKVEASMKKNLIHISLDVDDAQYHDAAFDKTSVHRNLSGWGCRQINRRALHQLGTASRR
jgi:hypothetical protein